MLKPKITEALGVCLKTVYNEIARTLQNVSIRKGPDIKLGKDFAFAQIAIDGMERSKRARKPRTKIYYCHPYSAYERGSNENMNRIIRRFFPKGTSFDEVTAADIGWATPQMLFERYIT